MLRKTVLLFFSLIFTIHSNAGQRASDAPVISVRAARVIAFFPPVSQSDLSNDNDGLNESLNDFQYYAGRVRAPLKKEGIDFDEVYAKSFRVRIAAQTSLFKPSEDRAGYYFIAPGKKPLIEYGVMTDLDILQIAKEYFRLR